MKALEQDMVGAAIQAPELTARIHLTEADFADPIAGAMWEAIGEIAAANRNPDPYLMDEAMRRRGIPGYDTGVYLDTYDKGMVVNADVYADRIRDAATRRSALNALERTRQLLEDPDEPVEQAWAELTTRMGDTTSRADEPPVMSLDDFVDQPIPPTEWIIPDVLARGDRCVITGEEGLGKSMALRQIAVCVAAGRQPFTSDAIEPRRVLVVDAENPLGIMVRKFGKMRDALRASGAETEGRCQIVRRPQGLNFGRAADPLWLHARCREFRPDLLVIGPAYKLYEGGSNSREEDLARQVTSVLDGLREEFGFALMLEHHSPHAVAGQKRTVRPVGSSLWMRWPEFGFGLSRADDGDRDIRTADLIHWRGAREERDWPARLTQGSVMPWVDASLPGY